MNDFRLEFFLLVKGAESLSRHRCARARPRLRLGSRDIIHKAFAGLSVNAFLCVLLIFTGAFGDFILRRLGLLLVELLGFLFGCL